MASRRAKFEQHKKKRKEIGRREEKNTHIEGILAAAAAAAAENGKKNGRDGGEQRRGGRRRTPASKKAEIPATDNGNGNSNGNTGSGNPGTEETRLFEIPFKSNFKINKRLFFLFFFLLLPSLSVASLKVEGSKKKAGTTGEGKISEKIHIWHRRF